MNSQVARVVEDVLRTDDEDDKVDEVDIAIKLSTPSRARDRIPTRRSRRCRTYAR